MNQLKHLTFVRTVTNLHVGSGQSVGTVDLPIAREKATNWPVIPGTSVKGVLKEAEITRLLAETNREPGKNQDAAFELTYLFGSPKDDSPQAGALTVSDQRLVLFPVRSFHGTFAWVTSPLALRRFAELAAIAGHGSLPPLDLPAEPDPRAFAGAGSLVAQDGKVLLEDLDLAASPHPDALKGYLDLIAGGAEVEADELRRRLVVVDDTVFGYLAETATEVTTKVSLKYETRTARDGFLRTEESVPPDAVFAGVALFQPRKSEDVAPIQEYVGRSRSQVLQFGGKASTGSGLCRFGFAGGGR